MAWPFGKEKKLGGECKRELSSEEKLALAYELKRNGQVFVSGKARDVIDVDEDPVKIGVNVDGNTCWYDPTWVVPVRRRSA